jgi:hypothetical protein
MKPILIKYNISENRAQEIADELSEIKDFSILSSITTIKDNVQKHLGLIAKNEIDFINEVCEVAYNCKGLYL